MFESFHTLGLTPDASTDEIKAAYKKLSLKYHPDVVPVERRPAAEAKFKEISSAYKTAMQWQGSPGRAPIDPASIRAMREQRYAAPGRGRVWLHPAALPLAAAFLGLATLTVYHTNQALERTRSASRPYGLLGPTVNEFLREDQYHTVQPFSQSSLGRMMGSSTKAASGKDATVDSTHTEGGKPSSR